MSASPSSRRRPGGLWDFVADWLLDSGKREDSRVIPGRDFVYAICAFNLIGAFDPSSSQRRLTRLGQLLQQLKVALDLLLRCVRRLLRFQFLIQPREQQPLHQLRRSRHAQRITPADSYLSCRILSTSLEECLSGCVQLRLGLRCKPLPVGQLDLDVLMLHGGNRFYIPGPLCGSKRSLQSAYRVEYQSAFSWIETPATPIRGFYTDHQYWMEQEDRGHIFFCQHQRFNHSMHRLAAFQSRHLRDDESGQMHSWMPFRRTR